MKSQQKLLLCITFRYVMESFAYLQLDPEPTQLLLIDSTAFMSLVHIGHQCILDSVRRREMNDDVTLL